MLDDDHVPISVPDPLEWAVLYEHSGTHVIAETRIDTVHVKTVFTGIDARLFSDDLAPEVFATFIDAPGPRRAAPVAYQTWEAARRGHARIVQSYAIPSVLTERRLRTAHSGLQQAANLSLAAPGCGVSGAVGEDGDRGTDAQRADHVRMRARREIDEER